MAFLNIIFLIYLCLAVPGPLCFAGCSLVGVSGGSSLAVVRGFPLRRLPLRQSTGSMFKLIDTGKPFDPTIVPDADVNLSAEDRQIGGLGIFLVRQIMDSVEYRRIDGKNILTMIKLL